MIKINKDYKHLNKSQIAHYYFCKELFNNPSPIVVPSIKEMDAEAEKREEMYRIELQQQELQDRNKTAEELADEAIQSVKDYWSRLENGLRPKEIER
jgi:hypothetical protein